MSNFTILLISYFAMLFIFGIIEINLQRRFANGKYEKTEKSFLLLIVPFYLATYLPPLEHNLLKQPIIKASVVIGFVLFIAAAIIRIVAMNTLRKNFSIAIETKKDGQLIVSGIYKYIRHPLYLAVVMMMVAACLIFSSWICWIFAALSTWGVLIRIKKEEAFLTNKFADYADYMKHSKKLLPGLF